jgi:GGDEF domain-containing protein
MPDDPIRVLLVESNDPDAARVEAALGDSSAGEGGRDFEELVRQADQSMYARKHRGLKAA